MKSARLAMAFTLAAMAAATASMAFALDGQITIHDPSTVVFCDGKYYTWGTGGTPLVSDDGWTWRAGTRPLRTGAAPDVIHIGDKYFMYIAGGGPPGPQPPAPSQYRAYITMIWSKSLDPQSPDYKWNDGGVVASSNGLEDSWAIDPGAFLDPTTHRLWLTYGTYVGYIRLVELDPKTGKRLDPNSKPYNLSINGEASDMFYHDGWYYLLQTRGSCCASSNSGYNIRMGRSRKVTGPYLDNDGTDMIEGGGKLLITGDERRIGAGHFGLMDLGQGVYKFSFHWEADLDRGGASVLEIRPLLFRNGWPVAGENFKEGTYEIQSVRTGTSLEMAVEGQPVGGGRGGRGGGGAGRGRGAAGGPPAQAPDAAGRGAQADAGRGAQADAGRGGGRGPGGGGGGMFGGSGTPIPDQQASQVDSNWPAGEVPVRMANYMLQAQQKWTIAPAPNGGGYPGSPYFKITIAGTDRTLAVGPDQELVVLPSFSGAPEQLWRIDEVAEGEWRIVPKSAAGSKEPLALSALGASFATLEKYDPSSEKMRWQIKLP
ncbi:MAG TPA: family 43 glycosylhydrolase [Bryobacteraceae bacterium]|nr:family 43 glycosylhydrolase [Bryobacteraceae bacterium]